VTSQFEKEDWYRCAALFSEAHRQHLELARREVRTGTVWAAATVAVVVFLPGWWKLLAILPALGLRAYEEAFVELFSFRMQVKGFFEGFRVGFDVGANRQHVQGTLRPVREVTPNESEWKFIEQIIRIGRG
jgi:hypothetical protein